MTEQIDFLPGFSSWGYSRPIPRLTPAQGKTLPRAGSYYSARDRVFHD
jgi:hypothetical protein